MFALRAQFKKCCDIVENQSWDEKSWAEIASDITTIVGTIGSAGYTYVTTTTLLNNFTKVLSSDLQGWSKITISGQRMQLIGSLGGKFALFLSLVATAQASFEAYSCYQNGKYGDMWMSVASGIGSAATALGLGLFMFGAKIFTSTVILNAIPVVGTILFVIGILISLALWLGPKLYEKFIKEETEKKFDTLWTYLEESLIFKCYTSKAHGANEQTNKAVKSVNGYKWDTDFTEMSWHAIVPLLQSGYKFEEVRKFVSDLWYIQGRKQDKDLIGLIRDYHELIKEEVTKNENGDEFMGNGSKTYKKIFHELVYGIYIPESDPNIYPSKYRFLADQFFSIPANKNGVSYIYLQWVTRRMPFPQLALATSQ